MEKQSISWTCYNWEKKKSKKKKKTEESSLFAMTFGFHKKIQLLIDHMFCSFVLCAIAIPSISHSFGLCAISLCWLWWCRFHRRRRLCTRHNSQCQFFTMTNETDTVYRSSGMFIAARDFNTYPFSIWVDRKIHWKRQKKTHSQREKKIILLGCFLFHSFFISLKFRFFFRFSPP